MIKTSIYTFISKIMKFESKPINRIYWAFNCEGYPRHCFENFCIPFGSCIKEHLKVICRYLHCTESIKWARFDCPLSPLWLASHAYVAWLSRERAENLIVDTVVFLLAIVPSITSVLISTLSVRKSN